MKKAEEKRMDPQNVWQFIFKKERELYFWTQVHKQEK